jgi:mannose-1-phosphate guanylyltransferase
MIVVIIAGGSGTRLWPLSTPDFPKQLLKLTNDKSMVQNTYDRALKLGSEIYVVPDISHAHHIKAQLPEVDEDHFVTEPVAAQASDKRKEIALIGIAPTFPATGFGYIERDGEVEGGHNVHKVESFKEKPDFEMARRYVASGKYLWNCGYFVGSVNTFLGEMEANAPLLKANYDALVAIEDETGEKYAKTYASFDNQVIDVALIEKVKNLVVVPASFDWVDLGSFKDLHEANESDQLGNHFRGKNIYEDEVENAYIRNEEDNKPVVVIGLDNVVVINTPNGILIARKDLSQKVKDAVGRMEKKS